MIRAARKAARKLTRDFGEVENLQGSKKGPADFVSAADLRAEETLRDELARARPDFGFLMEESGHRPGRDLEGRRWIVDPLDGTSNFLHGLPHFAISLALEARGDLLAGAGLNVPRCLLADDSFATLKRWRIEAVVETDAPGAPFDSGQPEHHDLLAAIGSHLVTFSR